MPTRRGRMNSEGLFLGAMPFIPYLFPGLPSVDLELARREDAMIARGDCGACFEWNGPRQDVAETGLCVTPEAAPQLAPGRRTRRVDGDLAEDPAHLSRGPVS